MRRHLMLTVTGLLLLLTGCGGSGSDPGADRPSTTTAIGASTTTGAGSQTTGTVTEVDGELLEAGELPAPWVAATDTAVHTFSALGPKGTPAYSASCPTSITDGAEGNTQCATYADEGGPFASVTVTASDGTSQTTLLCQTGDAESSDFTAFATLDATVALAGLGAADIDGRSLQASAYTTGTGTEWFVVRRPAGQDCPVLWDLGADDGTRAGASATAAVILPLVDGPMCVFVVPEGLRTRSAEDGICLP